MTTNVGNLVVSLSADRSRLDRVLADAERDLQALERRGGRFTLDARVTGTEQLSLLSRQLDVLENSYNRTRRTLSNPLGVRTDLSELRTATDILREFKDEADEDIEIGVHIDRREIEQTRRSLEELVQTPYHAELDVRVTGTEQLSLLSRQLDYVESRFQQAQATLSQALQVRVNTSEAQNAIALLDQLDSKTANLRLHLRPSVNLTELHDLNDLLDVKLEHIKQVQREAEIVVRADTQEIDQSIEKLKEARSLTEELQSVGKIEVEVSQSSQEVENKALSEHLRELNGIARSILDEVDGGGIFSALGGAIMAPFKSIFEGAFQRLGEFVTETTVRQLSYYLQGRTPPAVIAASSAKNMGDAVARAVAVSVADELRQGNAELVFEFAEIAHDLKQGQIGSLLRFVASSALTPLKSVVVGYYEGIGAQFSPGFATELDQATGGRISQSIASQGKKAGKIANIGYQALDTAQQPLRELREEISLLAKGLAGFRRDLTQGLKENGLVGLLENTASRAREITEVLERDESMPDSTKQVIGQAAEQVESLSERIKKVVEKGAALVDGSKVVSQIFPIQVIADQISRGVKSVQAVQGQAKGLIDTITIPFRVLENRGFSERFLEEVQKLGVEGYSVETDQNKIFQELQSKAEAMYAQYQERQTEFQEMGARRQQLMGTYPLLMMENPEIYQEVEKELRKFSQDYKNLNKEIEKLSQSLSIIGIALSRAKLNQLGQFGDAMIGYRDSEGNLAGFSNVAPVKLNGEDIPMLETLAIWDKDLSLVRKVLANLVEASAGVGFEGKLSGIPDNERLEKFYQRFGGTFAGDFDYADSPARPGTRNTFVPIGEDAEEYYSVYRFDRLKNQESSASPQQETGKPSLSEISGELRSFVEAVARLEGELRSFVEAVARLEGEIRKSIQAFTQAQEKPVKEPFLQNINDLSQSLSDVPGQVNSFVEAVARLEGEIQKSTQAFAQVQPGQAKEIPKSQSLELAQESSQEKQRIDELFRYFFGLLEQINGGIQFANTEFDQLLEDSGRISTSLSSIWNQLETTIDGLGEAVSNLMQANRNIYAIAEGMQAMGAPTGVGYDLGEGLETLIAGLGETVTELYKVNTAIRESIGGIEGVGDSRPRDALNQLVTSVDAIYNLLRDRFSGSGGLGFGGGEPPSSGPSGGLGFGGGEPPSSGPSGGELGGGSFVPRPDPSDPGSLYGLDEREQRKRALLATREWMVGESSQLYSRLSGLNIDFNKLKMKLVDRETEETPRFPKEIEQLRDVLSGTVAEAMLLAGTTSLNIEKYADTLIALRNLDPDAFNRLHSQIGTQTFDFTSFVEAINQAAASIQSGIHLATQVAPPPPQATPPSQPTQQAEVDLKAIQRVYKQFFKEQAGALFSDLLGQEVSVGLGNKIVNQDLQPVTLPPQLEQLKTLLPEATTQVFSSLGQVPDIDAIAGLADGLAVLQQINPSQFETYATQIAQGALDVRGLFASIETAFNTSEQHLEQAEGDLKELVNERFNRYLTQIVEESRTRAQQVITALSPDTDLSNPQIRQILRNAAGLDIEGGIADQMRSYREAIRQGNAALALELGEAILKQIQYARELVSQLGEQISEEGRVLLGGNSPEAANRALGQYEGEILRGHRGTGRIPSSLGEVPEVSESLTEAARNIASAYNLTQRQVLDAINEIVAAATSRSHEIQQGLSEGSPGPTFYIRENWAKTTKFVRGAITQLVEQANRAGTDIDRNWGASAGVKFFTSELERLKSKSQEAKASLNALAEPVVQAGSTRAAQLARQYEAVQRRAAELEARGWLKAERDRVRREAPETRLTQAQSSLKAQIQHLEQERAQVEQKLFARRKEISLALAKAEKAYRSRLSYLEQQSNRAEADGLSDRIQELQSVRQNLEREYAQRVSALRKLGQENEQTLGGRVQSIQRVQASSQRVLDRSNRGRPERQIQHLEQARQKAEAVLNKQGGLLQRLINAPLEAVNGLLGQINQRFPVLGNLARGIANVVLSITALLGLMSIGDAIAEFGRSAIQAAAELRVLEQSLDFATNGRGSQTLAQLKQQADELGVSFKTVARGFQEIAFSTLGTPLEGEAFGLVEALQQTFAIRGTGIQQQERVLSGVSQSIGKVRISLEEFIGQIAESMPGFLNTVSRALGTTTQELIRLAEAGELNAFEVWPKIAKQLEREANSGIAQAANSFQAKFNRVRTEFELLQAAFGEFSLGGLETILPVASSLLKALNENAEILVAVFSTGLLVAVIRLIGGLSTLVSIGGKVLGFFTGLATGATQASGALAAFRAVLMSTLKSFAAAAVITGGITTIIEVVNQGQGKIGDANKSIAQTAQKIAEAYKNASDAAKEFESNAPKGRASSDWLAFLDEFLGNLDPATRFTKTTAKGRKFREENPDYRTLMERWMPFARREADIRLRQTQSSILEAGNTERINREVLTQNGAIPIAEAVKQANVQLNAINLEITSTRAARVMAVARRAGQEEIDRLDQELEELQKQYDDTINNSVGNIASVESTIEQLETIKQELENLRALFKTIGREDDLNKNLADVERRLKSSTELLEQMRKATEANKDAFRQLAHEMALTASNLEVAQFDARMEAAKRETALYQRQIEENLSPSVIQRDIQKSQQQLNEDLLKGLESAYLENLETLEETDRKIRAEIAGILDNPAGENLDLFKLLKDPAELNAALQILEGQEGEITDRAKTTVDLINLIRSQSQELSQLNLEVVRGQLEISEETRQNAQSLRDFGSAVEEFYRENARNQRDLTENYTNLQRSLQRRLLEAAKQLKETRVRVENLQFQNALGEVLSPGSDGLGRQAADLFAGIREELSQVATAEEQAVLDRLDLEEQTLEISRQIRDLSEQRQDLERNTLRSLRELAEQAREFTGLNAKQWEEIGDHNNRIAKELEAVGDNFGDLTEKLKTSGHKLSDALERLVVKLGIASPSPTITNSTFSTSESNHLGEKIVRAALANEGWGRGIGLQCANAVREVLKDAGIDIGVTQLPLDRNLGNLPLGPAAARSFGTDQGQLISKIENLRPGDLVLYRDTYRGHIGDANDNEITHVGIYAGNNEVFDHSKARGLQRRSLSAPGGKFAGAIRLSEPESVLPVSLSHTTDAAVNSDLFRRLLLAEAGGEGTLGMAAVARATLNRLALVQSGKVPSGTYREQGKTLDSIINAPGQYQPVENGAINAPQSPAALEQARQAIALALDTDKLQAALSQEVGIQAARQILAATGFRTPTAFADRSQNFNPTQLGGHIFNSDRFAAQLNVPEVFEQQFGLPKLFNPSVSLSLNLDSLGTLGTVDLLTAIGEQQITQNDEQRRQQQIRANQQSRDKLVQFTLQNNDQLLQLDRQVRTSGESMQELLQASKGYLTLNERILASEQEISRQYRSQIELLADRERELERALEDLPGVIAKLREEVLPGADPETLKAAEDTISALEQQSETYEELLGKTRTQRTLLEQQAGIASRIAGEQTAREEGMKRREYLLEIETGLLEAQAEAFSSSQIEAAKLTAEAARMREELNLDRQLQQLDEMAKSYELSAQTVAELRNQLIAASQIRLDKIALESNFLLSKGIEIFADSFTSSLERLPNILSESESLFEALGKVAQGFFLSVLEGINQIAIQMASQALVRMLFGSLIGGLGGFSGSSGFVGDAIPATNIAHNGLKVQNFAQGGFASPLALGLSVIEAMQRERAMGGNPVPIVASVGERVLTPQQNAEYEALLAESKRLDAWESAGIQPPQTVPNYYQGGPVSQTTVTHHYSGGGDTINISYYGGTGDSFNRSAPQVAAAVRSGQERAARRLGKNSN